MMQFTIKMNLRKQNRTNEGHADMDLLTMTRFNREGCENVDAVIFLSLQTRSLYSIDRFFYK